MTVLSKFVETALKKYEKNFGGDRLTVSKSLVSLAVLIYTLKLTVPLLTTQKRKTSQILQIEENSKTDNNNKSSDTDNDSDSYLTDSNISCDSNENINEIESNNNNSQNNIINHTGLCNGNSNDDDNNDYDSNNTQNNINGNNNSKIKSIKKKTKGGKKKLTDNEKLLEDKMRIIQNSSKIRNEIGVNWKFLFQLRSLFKVMIPRPICYETKLLSYHTACLFSRTLLSIYVASLEGEIVKFIVRKDMKQFVIQLLKWFGVAIPATFVNSMIRFLENKLSLAFRTRLVKHSYRLYFRNQNYYRVSNLDGRIENADHRLTEDILVFSNSVAHLYSHLTKPCFDLLLIGLALLRASQNMKRSSNQTWSSMLIGPMFGFIVITTTAHILRILSPKFGQLVSEEANRYGYLRHIHSRIITNAEEIAFYGGHKAEHLQLREAYNRLIQQINLVSTKKLWFIMLEQFFMKYIWSGTGMIMISLPILTSSGATINSHSTTSNIHSTNLISDRTQYLTTSRNLLISGADAIERLMSSYKEITTLAGYTNRVASMLFVFKETSQGIYRKQIVERKNMEQISQNESNSSLDNIKFIDGRPIPAGKVNISTGTSSRDQLAIELINVPIVTPNCDVILKSLTLRIEPGTHLLITGPNGCGKSSLFRILSGLWPIYSGELYIPNPKPCGTPAMFYIPQRPYMSIGSLLDQIIYPDTREDMQKKNITEKELRNILKMVALEHIAIRDSFDVIKDWKDILSGGEKQRMAIARLFYHKPTYALLDECTSAVSIDVESKIYELAKSMGITLLTITHRPTLWKFHTNVLEFDGLGGYTFKELEKFRV